MPTFTLPALLLSASALSSGGAAEPRVDAITWLSIEPAPAAYNADSQFEGMPFDPIKRYVEANSPDLVHRVVTANPRRAWQLLSKGEKVCQTGSIRTAGREKLAYFTNTILSPPMQLIVRREELDKLPRNAAGEVDLAH